MSKDQDAAPDKASDAAPDKAGPKLTKMYRKLAAGTKGPTTADVHPSEVKNFEEHGWTVKEKA